MRRKSAANDLQQNTNAVGNHVEVRFFAGIAGRDWEFPMPGVIVLQGPAYDEANRKEFIAQIEDALDRWEFRENYPWISIVDSAPILDGSLDTSNLRDFLWLTFTRSDPAKDVFGYHAQIREKHWECAAPLIVDARIKPHHQKALTVPEEIRCRAQMILSEEHILEESK